MNWGYGKTDYVGIGFFHDFRLLANNDTSSVWVLPT